MRYAIFSDLHDSLRGFDLVLEDAHQRHVDQFIYLGDVGRSATLFRRLAELSIPCLFGNWEVSGYPRLPAPLDTTVAHWPARYWLPYACLTHATPDMPGEIETTAHAARYMQQTIGEQQMSGWARLFPRLHSQEEARWHALAALETFGVPIAFHGHTHIQRVWIYGQRDGGPHTALQRENSSDRSPSRWHQYHGEPVLPISLPTANRYLIGVGSAGQPHDGPYPRYAIYDTGQASDEQSTPGHPPATGSMPEHANAQAATIPATVELRTIRTAL